ncbi:MAG: HAD family hydrolase [Saccharofermentans sp.]|jgi:HAD superfamily phosphatase (TIGR01668 family)|nr:HAD family hydrolase [Saccharofermentans sp.]
MNIFEAMRPDRVYGSLKQIPWKELRDSGINVALLDFDNTLGIDRATEPDEYSYECIRMIEDAGIRCCLVSNAKSERSSGLAKALGIPCVTYARKPKPVGVYRAMELMRTSPEKALMVGDQVFTDVMAGRLAGCPTYMVEKYKKHEIWYVAIKRPFEKIVRLAGKF